MIGIVTIIRGELIKNVLCCQYAHKDLANLPLLTLWPFAVRGAHRSGSRHLLDTPTHSKRSTRTCQSNRDGEGLRLFFLRARKCSAREVCSLKHGWNFSRWICWIGTGILGDPAALRG